MGRSIIALALVALSTPAAAQAPRWAPEAGTRPYRYEIVAHIPQSGGSNYRLDYDLVSDGKGGMVAIVRAAWHHEADPEWVPAEIDQACRKALHAEGDELARITLSPIAPEAAANLSFIADCAPQDIMVPMTDILKVALVQTAPPFGAASLVKPGDRARFPGYTTTLEHPDNIVSATSTGGTIVFTGHVPGRATISWQSDPIQLKLLFRRAYSGADVTLTGTESVELKIDIDPATGVLLGVSTVRDAMDMTMTLPGGFSQPLPITREITIKPRP